MADNDHSGEFRRKNESIRSYWKGVRNALDTPLLARENLEDGFWPASRITIEPEDFRGEDGAIQEEFEEDPPFVGRRRDRPRPSFRVARDVFAGYFVIVRPHCADPKPFWLARAVTNPSPDPGHINSIRLQYWTPLSKRCPDPKTYDGWDTKVGNVWVEDTPIRPCWSNTSCVMTAFKARGKRGSDDQPQVLSKVTIPKVQINIIKLSVAQCLANSIDDASSTEEEE